MEHVFEQQELKSVQAIYRLHRRSQVRYWFLGFFIVLGIFLFLPWTQNIRAKGKVTTLRQEQRPQQINTIIPGRVVKWYVKEGQQVKAGDTILQLTEIKDGYLDPQLIQRTNEQAAAKEQSITYYREKAGAVSVQMEALEAARNVKLNQLGNKRQQLRYKLQSDSADAVAARNELEIARVQYDRQKKMYEEGLVSLTQFEQRNQVFQNAQAKKISAENKYMNTRQELYLLDMEYGAIQQDYLEKTAKASGDRFQSMSQVAEGAGEVAKLRNLSSTYSIRSGLYFITAAQAGQIVQLRKAGIGEVLKEGEQVGVIVPVGGEWGVEMYVKPVDLPLVSEGQKVRFVFDGFPAIVFSGWPDNSYGTFGGIVSAVENTVSENGKFRVLVAEDTTAGRWPQGLRMGTGAMGIALLRDVPVWYEIWRNVNGFPPDYYKTSNEIKDEKK
jgi:multidrug resistance efflux pump